MKKINKIPAQNGFICAEAHDIKPRLNYSFNLPQKCNLNQQIWNALVSISDVIFHMGPHHLAEAIYVIKPCGSPPLKRCPGLIFLFF